MEDCQGDIKMTFTVGNFVDDVDFSLYGDGVVCNIVCHITILIYF